MATPDTVGPGQAEGPLVLALDVGSSSVRGAVHDRLGRTVRGTVIQRSYEWDATPGGGVRLAPDVFIALVGEALDALDASVARLGATVVAGGIACFIHGIVGLDERGNPLTPVLSWADTTSSAEAAALRRRLDPVAVHARTGAPVHAGYWPARILRLRGEQPGIRRWAGLPELLARSLAGRSVVTRSIASGTGLLDRATGAWDDGILSVGDVAPDALSPIVADDESIGTLVGRAAKRWPRLSGIPWFGPWGDGGCGNVGLGAVGPGRAALMVGTSGAMRALVASPAAAVPEGLFAQRLGPFTVLGGQLSEGGGTLAWASRLLRRSQAALERAAAGLDPDEHGLTVLPYVFGERGLGYHDDARGSVIGLAPATDPSSLYRAILESIALSFADVDDRLTGALGSAPGIVASGGALEGSALLTRVLADALGRDIGVAFGLESSRRGAALLALWASGHLADVADAPLPSTSTVHADTARAARYRAARDRRNTLYRTLLG